MVGGCGDTEQLMPGLHPSFLMLSYQNTHMESEQPGIEHMDWTQNRGRSVSNQEKFKSERGRIEIPEGGGLASRVQWTWTEGPHGWMAEGQGGGRGTHCSAAAIPHGVTPDREKLPAGACLVFRLMCVEHDKTENSPKVFICLCSIY